VNNFETILTFNHPTELDMVRVRLEDEGIECLVPDEFTVIMNPLYSNAVGGVRLQVRESDIERAKEVLIHYGYIKTETEQETARESAWLKIGSTWPILKSFKAEVRISFIALTIVFAIIALAYWIIVPSTEERLMENTWCIRNLNYLKEEFAYDYKSPFYIAEYGYCSQHLEFNKDGTVELSNYFVSHFKGRWEIDGGELIISNVNSYDTIFNGSYEVDLDRENLNLTSKNTGIVCVVK
jgi:hypothetical protein